MIEEILFGGCFHDVPKSNLVCDPCYDKWVENVKTLTAERDAAIANTCKELETLTAAHVVTEKAIIAKYEAEISRLRGEIENVTKAAQRYREGAVKGLEAHKEVCEEKERWRTLAMKAKEALERMSWDKAHEPAHHCDYRVRFEANKCRAKGALAAYSEKGDGNGI